MCVKYLKSIYDEHWLEKGSGRSVADGYPGTCRRRAMEEEILWDPANL